MTAATAGLSAWLSKTRMFKVTTKYCAALDTTIADHDTTCWGSWPFS